MILTKEENIKSRDVVEVQCDICDKTKNIQYRSYLRNIDVYKIYCCCNKCSMCKNKLTNLERYGFNFASKNETIKSKQRNTIVKKHYKKRINAVHTINENYFNRINSHTKAYILGLLFSDGCNQTIKSTVKIVLKNGSSELMLLEEIKKEIFYSGDLIVKPNYIKLVLYSKKLSRSLEKIGVIQNKSLKLKFPNISKQFINSFILGVFDGDGGIYKYPCYTRNYGTLSFSIWGHGPFLEEISKHISENCHVSNNKFNPDKRSNTNIGFINWTGKNNIILIRDWLYKNSTMSLQRKKEILYSI